MWSPISGQHRQATSSPELRLGGFWYSVPLWLLLGIEIVRVAVRRRVPPYAVLACLPKILACRLSNYHLAHCFSTTEVPAFSLAPKTSLAASVSE